jgi:bifunctional pyridoxal-dependent enzyme with beta-cystathionase and maltose regulon repressor activities
MSDWFFNSATIEERTKSHSDRWLKEEEGVIPLTVADPDFHIAPEIKKAIIDAVENDDFNYTMGDTSLEEKCARKLTEFNKITATAEQIQLTNGTLPGVSIAVRHACSEGDEVIVNDPMYYPFKLLSELHGTIPVNWPLIYEDGFRFDNEKLKEVITKRTKLIYVCNPHNPTGRVMTREELRGVADVAVDHKITVMSDELWEDVIFDDREHVSIASLNPEIESLTLTQFGFSKAYNLAGLRMGYFCVTDKEMMESARKQAFGGLMVPTNFGKAVGHVIMSDELAWWHEGLNAHLHKIRGICERKFDEMPNVSYPKLEGTYLMFPKFHYDMPGEKFTEYLLKEAKVRLNDGAKFGELGEGHQRILIATSEALINEALDRMEGALKKL